MQPNHLRNQILSIAGTALLLALLHVANTSGSDYTIRILNNIAIFIILAVSYNLINGITGQFSLAPNAFVAIGSYTSALLTLTPMEKEISFIIEPCIWPLSVITTPLHRLACRGGCRGGPARIPDGIPRLPDPRRLPGHRHPGVRRSGPRHRQQHPEHHQRAPRAQGNRRLHEHLVGLGFRHHHGFSHRQDDPQQLRHGHEGRQVRPGSSRGGRHQHLLAQDARLHDERLLPGGGRGASGPPDHHDLAGALHVLPDLQPA